MNKFFSFLVVVFFALPANSGNYPVTVTDLDGNEITFERRPERIALNLNVDLIYLALLQRESPLEDVVIWGNSSVLGGGIELALYRHLESALPESRDIPVMEFGGGVNFEALIKAKPDLFIADSFFKIFFEKDEVFKRLDDLGTKVIFIDTFNNSVPNVLRNLELLSKVLDREAEYKEFEDYYNRKFNYLKETIAKQKKKLVFASVYAGFYGLDSCCGTNRKDLFGNLVMQLGLENWGDSFLSANEFQVSTEVLIKNQPDVFFLTTGNGAIPVGLSADEKAIREPMKRYLSQIGLSELQAIKNNDIVAMPTDFASSPINIVALEAIAKASYPEIFRELDPQKTYDEIFSRFTKLKASEDIQIYFLKPDRN